MKTNYTLTIKNLKIDFEVKQEFGAPVGRVVNAAKPDIANMIEPLFNKAMQVLERFSPTPDDKDFQPFNGEKGDDLDS